MTLIRIIFSDGTIFKVTFVGKTAISIQMLWLASQTFQLCHVSMLLCRLPESVVFSCKDISINDLFYRIAIIMKLC